MNAKVRGWNRRNKVEQKPVQTTCSGRGGTGFYIENPFHPRPTPRSDHHSTNAAVPPQRKNGGSNRDHDPGGRTTTPNDRRGPATTKAVPRPTSPRPRLVPPSTAGDLRLRPKRHVGLWCSPPHRTTTRLEVARPLRLDHLARPVVFRIRALQRNCGRRGGHCRNVSGLRTRLGVVTQFVVVSGQHHENPNFREGGAKSMTTTKRSHKAEGRTNPPPRLPTHGRDDQPQPTIGNPTTYARDSESSVTTCFPPRFAQFSDRLLP